MPSTAAGLTGTVLLGTTRVLGQEVAARLRLAVEGPARAVRGADAAAAETARADGDRRLVDVVGRAARVLVGMKEAGQAVLLVRLQHVDAGRRQQPEHRHDRD